MPSAKIVSMINPDTQIILKHFDDKFSQLVESLDSRISATVRPVIQEELVEVKQDIKTIKTEVKDTSKDLLHLDQRVEKLEAA